VATRIGWNPIEESTPIYCYRSMTRDHALFRPLLLGGSYTSRSLPTYPHPLLTSACHLMSIYVLRSVYGSKTECTLYTLFTELCTARVWRCRVTYDQHPRTNYNYYRIPPIFIPTSNHDLPGRRCVCRRPPAVGWFTCQS